MPGKETNKLQPLKLVIRHLASHAYHDLNSTLKIFMLYKSPPPIRCRNSNQLYVKLYQLFHIDCLNNSLNVNLQAMAIYHWKKAIWTRAGSVCTRMKTIHRELHVDFFPCLKIVTAKYPSFRSSSRN